MGKLEAGEKVVILQYILKKAFCETVLLWCKKMLVSFASGPFYTSVFSLLKLIRCLLHHLPGKLGSVSINVTALISRRQWQRQRRLVDVWSKTRWGNVWWAGPECA